MELNKTPIARALVFAGLIGLSANLSGCGNAEATDSSAKTNETEVISIPVETRPLTSGSITFTYNTTAILEAKEEAFVVARASGIIEHIHVEEGDYVEKGQTLAQLDKKRYELNLARAKADLRGIEQELNKINKVYSQKLVSDDTFDKLTAQYEAAQATLRLAELDLKETTITAPISGYIAERNAKVGNLTESFQREKMFHIVQQKELQGIVYLPESELRNLRQGQSATLTVPAITEHVAAYVDRISPVVDAQTGTFKVTLQVPNDDERLKAGMFSEVALNYARRENAMLMPRKALVSIDNQTSVFVVHDGVASKVDVALGFEEGDVVEVTEGLNGDESVVTAGHQNLKDQSPVEVVNS
ncbi:efflux RND transporter periplasmic adaptor subunit [Alteromonas aestuariivivens]|uniref:Efflux RND transporter periplasmic adaptor subunit n=1 Tax=Alteromonas aestuariivivens TaxID=1938339 RepID=A0A3D8MB94_9ALTE|nr:efflux RND transporter periplasmic adaptor subunit [Alteromonas aestuariivivens]RDV27401.1 efflux RND transporter periplasmic adaptor subunit [Alteromonas aestuariivivens]